MIVDLGLWAVGRLFGWLSRRPGEGPEADRRARIEAEVMRANERLASLESHVPTKDPKEVAR